MAAGNTSRPFSQYHKIAHRGCSKRLQRAVVDFGAETSFAHAAERITEHYGLELCPTVVRSVTLQHAARAEAFWNALEADDSAWREVSGNTPAPQAIVAEMDGTMIPIVATTQTTKQPDARKNRALEWKEIRLCAAQAHGKADALYSISLDEGTLHAGMELQKIVRFNGATPTTRIHGVGDGAPWIAAEVERQFGEQGSYLIDFFHVSDYLAAAAPTCCPEQPKLWLNNQQELLKANRSTQVLANLKQLCEPPPPVSTTVGYLEKRIHNLDYKSAIEAGLPIGSGLIESGHRHVLQQRLKLPGAWWSMRNARSMAVLRVIRTNRLWKHFWAA
jgi:hypothetical protein